MAQDGDCRTRGGGDTLFITHCAYAAAEFRVLHRHDGLIVGPDVTGDDVSGVVATLQHDRGGSATSTFCVRVRRHHEREVGVP